MKTTFDRSVYPTAECTTYKLFLTTPADWGPIQTSPAASRPDFGLSQACYFLCLHGHLMGNHHFSEVSQLILTQLCWVFLSLLQIKTEKVKYIYVHILCSAAALLSSVKLLCLDTAGYAAPLPSERLVLGSCSSGKVSLGKKKKKH